MSAGWILTVSATQIEDNVLVIRQSSQKHLVDHAMHTVMWVVPHRNGADRPRIDGESSAERSNEIGRVEGRQGDGRVGDSGEGLGVERLPMYEYGLQDVWT